MSTAPTGAAGRQDALAAAPCSRQRVHLSSGTQPCRSCELSFRTYHYRVLYSTYHYPCPSHTCSVAVRRRFGMCVLAVQRGGRLLPPHARRGGPRRLLQGLHTQRTARKHAVDATTTTKATRGCRPNALATRMPAMDAAYAMLPIMQLADLRHPRWSAMQYALHATLGAQLATFSNLGATPGQARHLPSIPVVQCVQCRTVSTLP